MNKAKSMHLKKGIVIGCLLLVMLTIWFFPIKSKNISIQLLTDGSHNDNVQISICSQQAHEPVYLNTYPITDGAVTVNIPSEYIPTDEIYVTDEAFALSVTGMKVLSNGIRVADYVSASFEGAPFEATGDKYVISSGANDAINKGIANPWLLRLIITLVLLASFVAVIVLKKLAKIIGGFKTAVICFIACSAVISLGIFNNNSTVLNIAGYGVDNRIIVAMIVFAVAALLIACVLVDKENKLSKVLIIAIYIFALIFAAGKMIFYSEKVENFPDESAHISYVAYLEQTNEFLPTFENMPMSTYTASDFETVTARFIDGTVNNLRHPPLYYHLMRISKAITFEDDNVYHIDIDRIRIPSMALAMMAFVLIFYIGYTRLRGYPLIHLLYSTIAISVPMMCYGLAGINNDTLTLLTVTVTAFGLLRYSENKRNVGTYLLIALGISGTVLTKMTAGIVVAIAALCVLGISLIKEKCWKNLISWQFLVTLPIYLAAVAYYMMVFVKYGAFQPELHALSEEYAWSTGFYLPVAERTVKSLYQYVFYFIDMFTKTWAGISSHISLLKTNDLDAVVFILIWAFPLMLLLDKNNKPAHKNTVGAIFAGVLVAVVLQFINGYNGLLSRGYLGGFQSRYYLCAIIIFALAAALLLQNAITTKNQNGNIIKNATISAAVVYIGLLTYGDFIYFILNYTNYLA